MQIVLIGNLKAESTQSIQKALTMEGYPVTTYNGEATGLSFFETFTKVRDLIIAADLVIADITITAPETLYQLALSLDYRRPTVLAISDKVKIENSLAEFKNRNLKVVNFKNLEVLKEQLIEYIYEIKDSLDAKLFMNIPPSMNKYLDWVATHTQYNKSDAVRNAVEKSAEVDKEYQAFIKSFE